MHQEYMSSRFWRGKIVCAFLYFAPVIDNILGAEMHSTGQDSSLGKIYRVFQLLMLLFVYFSTRIPKKQFIKVTAIMVLIACLPLSYALLDGNTSGLITDYTQLSKLVYPIILYIVCDVLIKGHNMQVGQIENVLNYYLWFYPLSLFIPYILNIGYQSYSAYDSGYSGFYGAGNELSIVLVAMYIVALQKAISSKHKGKMLLCAILNAGSAVLTGTKTGMIVLVLGTIFILLRDKNISKIVFRLLGGTAIMLVVLWIFRDKLADILGQNFDMIFYKYQQMDTDFVTFMLSARNTKIIPNFNDSILEGSHSIFNLLFGKGYYRQVVLTPKTAYTAERGLIEMDWFDVFFQHGIVILTTTAAFYLQKLRCAAKGENWIYRFASTIMLLYATLAGHTLQSTLPGTSLAILLILLNNAKEKWCNEKNFVDLQHVPV